jgi:hypothetical protein
MMCSWVHPLRIDSNVRLSEHLILDFRLMLEKRPALGESMWRMLHEHRFAAVVLMHDPDCDEFRNFYRGTHLGRRFLERLQQDYEVAGTPGGQYLYLPRGSASK